MWLFGRNGPSGFSASSTAEEVTEGIDGTGLTAIVTGNSIGLSLYRIKSKLGDYHIHVSILILWF